jgi:hypothetical protein
MAQTRLPFELDVGAEAGALTAWGGVPLVIEAFRTSGAAAVLDAAVVIKRRKRGLPTSELVEGLLALWAAGGERCEDLEQLREDAALALLLGHAFPAPQTARDFLEAFDEAAPPLWRGERCAVVAEGERLQGLAAGNRRWLQERSPQAVATIDVDATILKSQKRAALPTYDGRTAISRCWRCGPSRMWCWPMSSGTGTFLRAQATGEWWRRPLPRCHRE